MADLLDLADSALSGARRGEDVEAYAVHRVSTTVQAGTGGVIRQVSRAETRGLGIRLISGHRMGYASTAELSPNALRSTLERARINSGLSDSDVASQLPDPETAEPLSGLLDPHLPAIALEDKVALTAELARRVVGIDVRVRAIDTAEYADERVEVAVASTRGVRAQFARGHAELWSDALGEDAHGPASDYGYWCGRDPADANLAALALEAVDRTTRLLGPVRVAGSGVPLVLDRSVIGTLLAAVGRACNGGALWSGRSPFADSREAPAASPEVTLVDDGTLVTSTGAAPYDDEGVPRRRTTLITGGKVVGGLHTTATANSAGGHTRSTGNARRPTHKSAPRAAANALLLAPTTSHRELLSNTDEAIYLQQLTGGGSGINSVTGRVEVGGVGWLMRGGEPAGRMATVSLSTTLPELLRAIVGVGDDLRQAPLDPVVAATVRCDGQLLTRS